jgi:predicted secreted protein
MPAFNGTTVLLRADGNPVALLTGTTLNIEQDLPDATTKDSGGFADHINGLRSYSIDVDGLADFTGTTGNLKILTDFVMNRENVSFRFATTTSGQTQYTGTVSLASLSIEAGNESPATVSGSLTGKGELVLGTVS